MFFFGNGSRSIDEQRHQAAVAADKLESHILPDYPNGREIVSVDDVHEAAIQIDLSRSLAAYHIGEVVWHQATAHDDLQGMEWFDEQEAQKHYDRMTAIYNKIPNPSR